MSHWGSWTLKGYIKDCQKPSLWILWLMSENSIKEMVNLIVLTSSGLMMRLSCWVICPWRNVTDPVTGLISSPGSALPLPDTWQTQYTLLYHKYYTSHIENNHQYHYYYNFLFIYYIQKYFSCFSWLTSNLRVTLSALPLALRIVRLAVAVTSNSSTYNGGLCNIS